MYIVSSCRLTSFATHGDTRLQGMDALMRQIHAGVDGTPLCIAINLLATMDVPCEAHLLIEASQA